MKKDSKLADEIARWNRRHNETPEIRANREEESRKRAERRDAERLGREHVSFRSEHAQTVNGILNFMDIDFGPDSADNAQRLYQYLAEGRLRLIRREEVPYTERQNAAHVGALIRAAEKAADLDKFWGIKGKGDNARSAKLEDALEKVASVSKALEIYDSYLPPMAASKHGPCKQIPPERWEEIVPPDNADTEEND
jgi:hypothetical protein